MTLTLNEQEYTTLAEEAAKNGQQPEMFLHDIIQRLRTFPQVKRPLTDQEFMEKLYREGKLLNLPVPRPLTSEEEAERERLGRLFAGAKPLSEMIIEDRGPY